MCASRFSEAKASLGSNQRWPIHRLIVLERKYAAFVSVCIRQKFILYIRLGHLTELGLKRIITGSSKPASVTEKCWQSVVTLAFMNFV